MRSCKLSAGEIVVESLGFTGRNSTVLLSIVCIIRRHAQGELQLVSHEHRQAMNGMSAYLYTVNEGLAKAKLVSRTLIYNKNKFVNNLMEIKVRVQIGAQHA